MQKGKELYGIVAAFSLVLAAVLVLAFSFITTADRRARKLSAEKGEITQPASAHQTPREAALKGGDTTSTPAANTEPVDTRSARPPVEKHEHNVSATTTFAL